VRQFQADDRNFLLPPSDESFTPDTYLDISHEALLRQWRRFSEWLESERTAVTELRRLVDGARLYREGGRALLQRKEFDRVSQWGKENEPSAEWAQRYVTSDEWHEAQNFIEKSAEGLKQHEAAAEEERERQLRVAAERAKEAEKYAKDQEEAASKADRLAKAADDARNQADSLTNFILFDLCDKLVRIGRLDVLSDVVQKTKQYSGGLPKMQ
jgi:hypothetical protein